MPPLVAIGLLYAALGADAVTIDADFPAGNIVVQRIAGDEVFLRQDLRDTNGWWFYWCFRAKHTQGRTLTFHLGDKRVLGPQGPAYSRDAGRTWQWLGPKRTNAERPPPQDGFVFRFPDDADEVRFCFAIPYVEADLRRFLERHKASPGLKVDVLCKTPKGRAAELVYLGRLDEPADYHVAFTCRHHACESIASFVLEGLVEAILADDDVGRWYRGHAAVAAVPFVDKDGVEAGDQGKNRKPHDHNRDYAGEGLYPTVAAIKRLLPRWSAGRLDVALDLHCPSVGDRLIQFIGVPDEAIWRREMALSRALEACQTGPLRHDAARNVPFGTSWNTGAGLKGASFAGWASGLPGIGVAGTLETPYAQVGTTPVTAEAARTLGRDLAAAIHKQLIHERREGARRKEARSEEKAVTVPRLAGPPEAPRGASCLRRVGS